MFGRQVEERPQGKWMIRVANLVKHYERGLVKALNGLSFDVAKGEIVAIMGPSGCGKSTLLNLIGTLDLPTSGEIRIDGKNSLDYRPFDRFRAEMVGFVFQFHHLIPSLTLQENVELPMYSLPVSKKTRRRKALEIMRIMGLAERLNFLLTRVSGGERQRAAIARAIVNDPRIILADEPTGSVDTETGSRILEFLVKRCRDRDITMLLATHNEEIAAKFDRTIHIKNGLIEKDLGR